MCGYTYLWAARNRIASIGIRHPPKVKQANAQNLFSGSAEEIRIARGAWIALPDPKNADPGLFLLAKSNHIADKRGFAYRIEGVTLASGITTSRVAWENGRADGTADDYLAGAFGSIRPGRQQKAKTPHLHQTARQSCVSLRINRHDGWRKTFIHFSHFHHHRQDRRRRKLTSR